MLATVMILDQTSGLFQWNVFHPKSWNPTKTEKEQQTWLTYKCSTCWCESRKSPGASIPRLATISDDIRPAWQLRRNLSPSGTESSLPNMTSSHSISLICALNIYRCLWLWTSNAAPIASAWEIAHTCFLALDHTFLQLGSKIKWAQDYDLELSVRVTNLSLNILYVLLIPASPLEQSVWVKTY